MGSLSENKARLAAIADNIVDGLITIDANGTILDFNKACEKIFGYEASETVGQNVKMLMPEPYQNEHDQYISHYRETKQKKIIGIGREVRGKRKDGSTFPLDLSVSEIQLDDKVIYSGILRDISVQKETEAAILATNAELEEFAYRTSHDLRSPLISSSRLLALVKEMINNEKQDDALQAVDHALKSLSQLESLVDKILHFVKNKYLDEEYTVVSVEDLVKESIEKLSHMEHFDRLNIRQSYQHGENVITLHHRLVLIIENLLSNAIKYQNINEEASFISIETHTDKEFFSFIITDNGLGIPRDKQDELFVMFRRFHTKASKGSGLGLYMVQKSAELLGGAVRYEPQTPGSRFILTIPHQHQNKIAL